MGSRSCRCTDRRPRLPRHATNKRASGLTVPVILSGIKHWGNLRCERPCQRPVGGASHKSPNTWPLRAGGHSQRPAREDGSGLYRVHLNGYLKDVSRNGSSICHSGKKTEPPIQQHSREALAALPRAPGLVRRTLRLSAPVSEGISIRVDAFWLRRSGWLISVAGAAKLGPTPSTIRLTASKGARRAPSMWGRSARNYGAW